MQCSMCAYCAMQRYSDWLLKLLFKTLIVSKNYSILECRRLNFFLFFNAWVVLFLKWAFRASGQNYLRFVLPHGQPPLIEFPSVASYHSLGRRLHYSVPLKHSHTHLSCRRAQLIWSKNRKKSFHSFVIRKSLSMSLNKGFVYFYRCCPILPRYLDSSWNITNLREESLANVYLRVLPVDRMFAWSLPDLHVRFWPSSLVFQSLTTYVTRNRSRPVWPKVESPPYFCISVEREISYLMIWKSTLLHHIQCF